MPTTSFFTRKTIRPKTNSTNQLMFCKKYLPLHYFIYGRHILVDRYKISISNDKGYFPFYVDFVFPLTSTNVVARFTNGSNKQKLFILRKQLGSSPVVGGVRVFTKFVFCVAFFFFFLLVLILVLYTKCCQCISIVHS